MPDESIDKLSRRLRLATSELHQQAEMTLDLPAAIRDRESYAAALGRFLSLYAPLEKAMTRHAGWAALGLDLRERSHAARLARDLAAMGCEVEPAAADGFGALASFAHAIGALYVLEGSTLGGQIILRDLQERGIGIEANEMSFFTGHGAATGTMWRSFSQTLDRFGREHPEAIGDVEDGAMETFAAVIRRFS